MSESPPTTLLEDAIDIPIWLEADKSLPLPRRTQRDREIAGRLDVGDSASRVRAWWRSIDHHGDARTGRRLETARGWLTVALVIVGGIGGVGLALAAFRYDGTFPVNVVRLLALLVVPQIVLIMLSLFLIPGRVPGLRFVQDGLAAINPGALAAAVYRQLRNRPEARVFGAVSAPTAAARRFARWQILHWSQISAVAFNLAVVATAVLLIAFTDLAFGWSTTLDVASETAAKIFGAIASPWAFAFPDAVPDQTLVERSQFFRLAGQSGLPDSRALTGWWSFTLLAVVVYGLIPRVVLFCVTGLRLKAATRALLLEDSGVVALLDRMSSPAVETRGAAHEEMRVEHVREGGRAPRAGLEGTAGAVVWSQAIDPQRVTALVSERLGLVLGQVVDAGGSTLDADRRTLESFRGTSGPVVVLTPAWEPPLLEFDDFIAGLRQTIGTARSIIVVPLGESLREATSAEAENWSLAVGRIGDPHTYVEAGRQ